MSFADVRSYFKARMAAVGKTEWQDAFNLENIPATMLAKSYHLATESITQVSHNQQCLELSWPVKVTFFSVGYRNMSEAYSAAIATAESILVECTKQANAKTQTNIKDVQLDRIDFAEFSVEDDNVIKCEVNFNVRFGYNVNA